MDELDNRPGSAEQAETEEAERRLEDAAPGTEEPVWELPDGTPEERRLFLAEEQDLSEAGLLEQLCRDAAKRIGRRCLDECGGDVTAAREAYARYWTAREAAGRERRQRAEAEREETLLSRLTEEFDVLRAQVPAVREPDQIPAPVLQAAVDEGISLFDAYLRYAWAEYRRAEEAREAAGRAAACSAGRLEDRPDQPGTEQEIFSAVFREAVK